MEWLFTIVAGLIIAAFTGLWWWVRKLKINDMTHINKRLDGIEKKLDAHIQWHLDNK